MQGPTQITQNPLTDFEKMLKQELPNAFERFQKIDVVCAYFFGKACKTGLSLSFEDIQKKIAGYQAKNKKTHKVAYTETALNPTGSMLRDMNFAWAITHYASPEVYLALCARSLSDPLLPKPSKTTSCIKLVRDSGLIAGLYYFPWILSQYYNEYEEEYGFAAQLIAPSLVLLSYEGGNIAKQCIKTTKNLCQAAHEFSGMMCDYYEEDNTPSSSLTPPVTKP